MAKVYKQGDWAKHGRVMPGQRTKAKVIDQILEDGTITQTNCDQVFKPSEVKSLLLKYFSDGIEKNGRIYLNSLVEKGQSVCFYTRNIHHLGGDWSPEKKRIQVENDFPEFYRNNKQQGVETILLGIYHYYPDRTNGVILFTCFSAATYAAKKPHNSAAHIHTIDLQNAQKNGVYRRIDKAGNELLVLDKVNFIKHVNALRGAEEVLSVQNDREILNYLGTMFDSMPRKMLGIDCYKEMMAAGDKTRMRQSAWEGWYYEFFVSRYLANHPTDNIVWWAKKGQGKLDFDLRFPCCKWFFGDVKADAKGKSVQGNKKENIDFLVLEKGGRLWYITIDFTPERDAAHNYVTTRWWNEQLGKQDRPLSYCTRMKYSIDINSMDIYEITKSTIPYLKEYRPSPCKGKDRQPKYLIPHKMKEFLRIYKRT